MAEKAISLHKLPQQSEAILVHCYNKIPVLFTSSNFLSYTSEFTMQDLILRADFIRNTSIYT